MAPRCSACPASPAGAPRPPPRGEPKVSRTEDALGRVPTRLPGRGAAAGRARRKRPAGQGRQAAPIARPGYRGDAVPDPPSARPPRRHHPARPQPPPSPPLYLHGPAEEGARVGRQLLHVEIHDVHAGRQAGRAAGCASGEAGSAAAGLGRRATATATAGRTW